MAVYGLPDGFRVRGREPFPIAISPGSIFSTEKVPHPLHMVRARAGLYNHCMTPPDAPTSQNWTVQRLLEWTTGFFTRKSLDSPRLQAEMLLSHALGLPRIGLYTQFDRVISPIVLAGFRDLVKRAGEQEPVAYLTGTAHFYGLQLKVSPAVLIPRPDTETLVESPLRHLKIATDTGPAEPLRVLDLCTGSGCVALALAKHLPQARVIAVDLSPEAAAIAEENAASLGLSDRVEIRVGDLFEPLGGQAPFHLITANPPYVPTEGIQSLDRNVRDYEPRLALDGGADGLNITRRIIAGARDRLQPGGRLYIELQFDQAEAALEIAESAGPWETVSILRDLAGHERAIYARCAM